MTEHIRELTSAFPVWVGQSLNAIVIVMIAIVLALLLHRLLFAGVRRLANLSETPLDDMVFDRLYRPLRWAMAAIAIAIASQADATLALAWQKIAVFAVPAIIGWIAYTLIKVLAHALEYRVELSDDPVATRSRRTRIAILSRTAVVVVVVITIGLMLLGIPGVRDIGTTMLASAGIAALAVGAAAQPALKSLIAGLQMAITEPLRIGDLVVVDGHTGRVEEIRMSFVVVRTWDERAIVVPTGRFLEESFENWSRKNEMLTGPVFLHLDPATEIGPIRDEFLRYLATQQLWDGRTGRALLTDAHPESIELRLAMSARTIGELFDLRCAVREHMIGWLRTEMPDALIRHRLITQAPAEG
ncbi:MAG TPA: mechanosensitive ion channel domain-containing protein [Sphingomonadaceae bacterium]|nr:mechanosensitive ion channel domain-containing protein [Sphingomonadaceae bacterium]